MIKIDLSIINKITHEAEAPVLDDSFAKDVKRAESALAMGIDLGAVAESLSLDMPVEEAHLIARAGELHLEWEEDEAWESDTSVEGRRVVSQ